MMLNGVVLQQVGGVGAQPGSIPGGGHVTSARPPTYAVAGGPGSGDSVKLTTSAGDLPSTTITTTVGTKHVVPGGAGTAMNGCGCDAPAATAHGDLGGYSGAGSGVDGGTPTNGVAVSDEQVFRCHIIEPLLSHSREDGFDQDDCKKIRRFTVGYTTMQISGGLIQDFKHTF